MKRNYNKQDKIKWIVTSVAFVLAFVMIAGIFMQLFAKNEKYKPSTWFSKACVKHEYNEEDKCTKCGKEKPIEEEGDSAVISEGESHGMRLMSARLVSDGVASNDIESQGNDQYALTATITPSNADNQRVIWSIAWVNPESAWVKSNNNPVTNYVSISSLNTETTTLSITVTCKYAFGERIKITCTSVSNASVQATCNVDYQRKFLGTRFKLINGNYGFTLDKSQSNSSTWRWDTFKGDRDTMDAWGRGTNEYTPYYSIYTTTTNAPVPTSYSLTVTASDALKAVFDSMNLYSRDYRRSFTYNFVDNYSVGRFTQRHIMGSAEWGFEGVFYDFMSSYEDDGTYDEFYAESYSKLRTALLSCSVDLIITINTTLSNGQIISERFEVNIADDTLQVPVTGLSLNGNLVF